MNAFEELSIELIEEEFGDCEFMRGSMNGWTVDAVLWLMAKVNSQQAEIDALMFEFCPGEMTPKQTINWAKRQKLSDLKKEDLEMNEKSI